MKHILIIGQGIAGTLLAWHLSKAGCTSIIVDRRHQDSSSMVAAGLVNPITGQRLALTPHFDRFAKTAYETYAAIGSELGSNFFIEKPIIRILRSAQEEERARYLTTAPESSRYALEVKPPGAHAKALNDPFGSLIIQEGGHLRTKIFLNTLKSYFLDKKMLIETTIKHSDIKIHQDYVAWNTQRFDAVICCEGFAAKDNPWFSHLPYNLAKGEIMKVTIDTPLPDALLCQQQWLLPDEDGSYWAGSTYDRVNINTSPTPEGESTIIEGLKNFVNTDIRVLERYAGVRPVMLDQQPVVGIHPSLERVGIFNGFASKGILWAPHYAKNFALTLSKGRFPILESRT